MLLILIFLERDVYNTCFEIFLEIGVFKGFSKVKSGFLRFFLDADRVFLLSEVEALPGKSQGRQSGRGAGSILLASPVLVPYSPGVSL